MHTKLVGLKKLRENVDSFAREVGRGSSFVIVRRSEPLFKITSVDDDTWEEVVDFTKIRRGGIEVGELLKRL